MEVLKHGFYLRKYWKMHFPDKKASQGMLQIALSRMQDQRPDVPAAIPVTRRRANNQRSHLCQMPGGGENTSDSSCSGLLKQQPQHLDAPHASGSEYVFECEQSEVARIGAEKTATDRAAGSLAAKCCTFVACHTRPNLMVGTRVELFGRSPHA